MPDSLFNETRVLFHALTRWGEALHEGLGLTMPMRAVLELALLGGPATVPDMARARGVSRQHVQQQVDPLLKRGLLMREDNPAHKRSSMIALTDKGRALIRSMRAKEIDTLAKMQVGVSDNAMLEAAQVLSAWRITLQRDTERRMS